MLSSLVNQRAFVTTVRMVCICSLAAGIKNDSRICSGIMPAATSGFTGVLGDSVYFNLEILRFIDGSLFPLLLVFASYSSYDLSSG